MNERNARRVRRFEALMYHVGYGLVIVTGLAVAAELVSMLVVGVHRGMRVRLAAIAPEIARPAPDDPWFSLRNRLLDDVRRASGVYDGEPWADAFLAESAGPSPPMVYEPYRVWGNSETHRTYVNVDPGPLGFWRRTVNECRRDGRAADVQVWMLGASVMFGVDAPDFATIPSYVSLELNSATGRCIEVTNLAVPGYVISQAAILVGELLKSGRRPDMVVYLGGVNESWVGAYSPGLASAHGDLIEIREKLQREFDVGGALDRSHAVTIARAVVRRFRPPVLLSAGPNGTTVPVDVSDDTVKRRARETLDNYEANIRILLALGREYGFGARFFWQPTLSVGTHKPSPLEQLILDHPMFNPVPEENHIVGLVYEEAERRASRNGTFQYLGGIFDDVPGTVYIDGVHVGPRGNAIVAGAIARTIPAP